MTEYHKTAAGFVYLQPMGVGMWGVHTKNGGALLGTVQLVTEDGKYEASARGKTQECANLDAAIKVVGANG